MNKILMVCEAFGGGVFTYVSQLCNDMAGIFDVYLAFSLRSQTPKNYKEFLDPRIHLIQVESWNGKPIADIGNDIKSINEMRSIAEKVRPDIIHLHSSIAGGIGRLAFDGKDSVVIYTPHGYAHVLMGPGVKSRIYKIMEKILGKRNAITLSCCKSEDEVAKTLCKKTAYIETGVNLQDLSNVLNGIMPIKNERFTVFTLGRICTQKRPQVFNRIAELVPEARFVWIGDGEMRNVLTAPNIEVTGWKPRHEALALAKGADAFVLCSFGEAIAMSLIENMYIKKLCLVSNVMGNISVIKNGENGYVCDKPEEYSERIYDAMGEFPYEITEKAYQDVLSIYNTKVMREKYIAFYKSVIID